MDGQELKIIFGIIQRDDFDGADVVTIKLESRE